LVLSQSTGFSIFSIKTRLDGMIDPTITGCLKNPRRNCHCGLGERRSRRRVWRRDPFSVRTLEVVMTDLSRAPERREHWRKRLLLARFESRRRHENRAVQPMRDVLPLATFLAARP
jgi:hypothetical protein